MKQLNRLLLIYLVLSFSFLTICSAQNRDPERERIIENELIKLNSSMLPIYKAATIALDQNDFMKADSLYTLIYEKYPSFDPVLRRMGAIRLQTGRIDEGIRFCRDAVMLNRSSGNLMTLSVCLAQPGKYQNYSEALSLLREARSLPDGKDIDILSLMGQIQLENGSVTDFRNTVGLLKTEFPDEMITHYYNAILSAADEDWLTARKEIESAKATGLSEEIVNEFMDSGVKKHIMIRNYGFSLLWIFIAWASGLLILFILGKVLSAKIMNSIDDISKIESLSGSVKSVYKWLINVGGIYYYFSLPVILILVVALVVSLTYLFLLIGRIPVKLMIILVIGSAVTIYAMIRSLMVKTKYADPGRSLEEQEAPKLYALVRDVAHTLCTRPIDEIRITYGTDLAVYEKGSWRQRQQNAAKRVLILGAAVVENFRNNDFRSILAHEYGHFAHRDTAGGDVALRVRDDMNKYLYTLYVSGQNVWWNIAFQFLRLYSFLFRRISFGSTRLQEILADNVAARTFGAVAFVNGLTHVIRRDIEFNDLIDQNVEEIRNARPSINVYSIPGSPEKYSAHLEKSLNCATTEDDTHPSPKDRFRLVSGFNVLSDPADTDCVSDLFSDWDRIKTEMREFIDKQIRKNN